MDHLIFVFAAAGALLGLAMSARATVSFMKSVNLHMMMETLSFSMSFAAEDASFVKGAPEAGREPTGTKVFAYEGSYNASGWTAQGNGRLAGQDFTLSQAGTLQGELGNDLTLLAVGSFSMGGNSANTVTSATLKWGWQPPATQQFRSRRLPLSLKRNCQ